MTTVIIICTALLTILISLVGYQVAHLHDSLVSDGRLKPKPVKCKIDTESGGLFIGRKYCSTHDVFWDSPTRECPGVVEDARALTALPLSMGTPIPLWFNGKVVDFVPDSWNGGWNGGGGVEVILIDRKTWEQRNRVQP